MWVDGGWQDITVTHDWPLGDVPGQAMQSVSKRWLTKSHLPRLVISGLAFGLLLLLCYSVIKWLWKEISHDWKFSCDAPALVAEGWLDRHEAKPCKTLFLASCCAYPRFGWPRMNICGKEPKDPWHQSCGWPT